MDDEYPLTCTTVEIDNDGQLKQLEGYWIDPLSKRTYPFKYTINSRGTFDGSFATDQSVRIFEFDVHIARVGTCVSGSGENRIGAFTLTGQYNKTLIKTYTKRFTAKDHQDATRGFWSILPVTLYPKPMNRARAAYALRVAYSDRLFHIEHMLLKRDVDDSVFLDALEAQYPHLSDEHELFKWIMYLDRKFGSDEFERCVQNQVDDQCRRLWQDVTALQRQMIEFERQLST